MSTRLEADNLSSVNVKQQSMLNADVAGGATSITLWNASGILTNDWLFIGRQAAERCEMRQVSNVAGNVVTLSAALGFDHAKGDPIVAAYGNRVRFKYAPNTNGDLPAADQFALISGGEVEIVADSAVTSFVDVSGTSGNWYLYVFYNSVTNAETDISAALRGAARGDDYGHYVELDSIRDEAGFKDANYVEDQLVDEKRADAEAMVNSKCSKITTVPFLEPYPRQIVMITRRMAAGWLLLKEYGPNTEGNPKSEAGQKLVDWAELQLEGIENGKIPLLDADGNDMRNTSSEFAFSPNAASDEPYFTMGQVF